MTKNITTFIQFHCKVDLTFLQQMAREPKISFDLSIQLFWTVSELILINFELKFDYLDFTSAWPGVEAGHVYLGPERQVTCGTSPFNHLVISIVIFNSLLICVLHPVQKAAIFSSCSPIHLSMTPCLSQLIQCHHLPLSHVDDEKENNRTATWLRWGASRSPATAQTSSSSTSWRSMSTSSGRWTFQGPHFALQMGWH